MSPVLLMAPRVCPAMDQGAVALLPIALLRALPVYRDEVEAGARGRGV